MGITTIYSATCDVCGHSKTMHPINPSIPNTGFALPPDWVRDKINPDIIICDACKATYVRPVQDGVIKAEWAEVSAVKCKNCNWMVEDKLLQCPYCRAEMSNGDTNYR